MKFLVQQAGRQLGLGGMLLVAVWAMPTAHAADPNPVFSLNGVQVQSSNLGYSPTISGQSVSRVLGSTQRELLNSETVVEDVWEVSTAPTTTTGGVESMFKVTTSTKEFQNYRWIYDTATISTASQSGQLSGGKWISISGSITSSIDHSISPSLSAYGSFTPVNTPFGEAAPALASLYFGSSMTSLMPTLMYSSSGGTGYSVSANGGLVNFVSGQPQSFVALAYAAEGVSLDSLQVSWSEYLREPLGSTYQEIDTKREWSSSRPLAPIPEPETYALALAGLGVVGWMARRRRV